MIQVTPDTIIASSNDSILEAIDLEIDTNKKGGVIIFSTDINAIKLDENKLINKIKQVINTINNRIFKINKVDKVAQKYNLAGWTVGKFLSRRYTTKRGTPFGENSLSVEIIGVDSDTLIKIAEDLCDSFIQEEVLVKNYIDGNIYFVSGNDNHESI